MKVKATIVAPEPPSPQTLADLSEGVKARVQFSNSDVGVRWRHGPFVLGESGGFVRVMNTRFEDDHPRIVDGPDHYIVLDVLDPPAEKPKTLAELDNGVLADVYLHPNPDHILRRWRSCDHVLGRAADGCIGVTNSSLGTQPKDYLVRKVLGKFIVEFME